MKLDKLQTLLLGVLCLTYIAPLNRTVAQSPDKPTIVEQSASLPAPPRGTLGTANYKPTEKESAFFSKLAPNEITTGSLFNDYFITGKKGSFIGWFGIVRKIEEESNAQQTKLLVEHKYFDGLTDTHIQALSFEGGGDFTAVLSGTGLGIKPLSLVKVYGTVTAEVESVPAVHSDYVRQWDWGQFTFMDLYGTQKGNKEWKKLNKVKDDRMYNPFPKQKYYEDRLGPRNQ